MAPSTIWQPSRRWRGTGASPGGGRARVSASALSHTLRAWKNATACVCSPARPAASPDPAGERLLRSPRPRPRRSREGPRRPGGLARRTVGQPAPDHVSLRRPHHPRTEAAPLPDRPPRHLGRVVVDDRLTDIVAAGSMRASASVRRSSGTWWRCGLVRTAHGGGRTPGYFASHPRPETPADLETHRCVNYRLVGGGGLLPWEFARDGREVASEQAVNWS